MWEHFKKTRAIITKKLRARKLKSSSIDFLISFIFGFVLQYSDSSFMSPDPLGSLYLRFSINILHFKTVKSWLRSASTMMHSEGSEGWELGTVSRSFSAAWPLVSASLCTRAPFLLLAEDWLPLLSWAWFIGVAHKWCLWLTRLLIQHLYFAAGGFLCPSSKFLWEKPSD